MHLRVAFGSVAAFGLAMVVGAGVSSCATAAVEPFEDVGEAGPDVAVCPDKDITSDPKNCGGCGHACTSAQICVAGACKAECDSPKVKCLGSGGSAAGCFDLSKDPQHCGTCATTCGLGDAGALDPSNGNPDSGLFPEGGTASGTPWDLGMPGCAQSKCTIACSGGKQSCDGVCFDLQQDHDHCGDCNTACDPASWCGNGHCCPSGQLFCGGACVDVSSDSANCGACGNACGGTTPNCYAGNCIAGLTISVEGHADVVVNCTPGDYKCEAQQVCNKVTSSVCVYQAYDCYSGSGGSWYPPDGASGTSAFNFAYSYDYGGGGTSGYGNICSCTRTQMTKYGLAATHTYCGLGHWTRK